eukprot:gene10023-biopygen12286
MPAPRPRHPTPKKMFTARATPTTLPAPVSRSSCGSGARVGQATCAAQWPRPPGGEAEPLPVSTSEAWCMRGLATSSLKRSPERVPRAGRYRGNRTMARAWRGLILALGGAGVARAWRGHVLFPQGVGSVRVAAPPPPHTLPLCLPFPRGNDSAAPPEAALGGVTSTDHANLIWEGEQPARVQLISGCHILDIFGGNRPKVVLFWQDRAQTFPSTPGEEPGSRLIWGGTASTGKLGGGADRGNGRHDDGSLGPGAGALQPQAQQRERGDTPANALYRCNGGWEQSRPKIHPSAFNVNPSTILKPVLVEVRKAPH